VITKTVLVIAKARRRNEHHGRERRRDEGDEEDVAVQLPELREAVGKRHGEQEGEEHLHTGERHPQLVQELDQLSVVTILAALVGHTSLFQPAWTLETGVFLN